MTTIFVLVADARSAKLLKRAANGDLEEQWQLYSADDRVRALGDSPDTREVPTTPTTPESSAYANTAFADEVGAQLAETCGETEVTSILLIAPKHFGEVLQRSLSPTLWQRVQHSIPRDKTDLGDNDLRKLVDETVAIYA